MNVLILTAGSRVQTVRYFQNALAGEGKVIATDASELAPTLYAADGFHVVPLIADENYLSTILQICQDDQIDVALSLYDPELSLMAKHADDFAKVGTQLMLSPSEVIECAFDKWEFFNWLDGHGYATPKSWIELDQVKADLAAGKAQFPLFVKSRTGSASAGIAKIEDLPQLEKAMAETPDLIIQEFMPGEPIDVDCYVDMISGQVVSIFAKKKLRMRAGTADKSVSFKDDSLFELVVDFATAAGYRGAIDIDLFSTPTGWSILEVNPRFGGVYPHAYECGIDFPSMVLNNVRGQVNEPNIGAYESDWAMLGYDAPLMRKITGLVD